MNKLLVIILGVAVIGLVVAWVMTNNAEAVNWNSSTPSQLAVNWNS